jgi:hypothetical protein
MWLPIYRNFLFPALGADAGQLPTSDISKVMAWGYSILHGDEPPGPPQSTLLLCLLSELTNESEKPVGRSNLWLTDRVSESHSNLLPVVVLAWTYNCGARAQWWCKEDMRKALSLSEMAFSKCDLQNPRERETSVWIAVDHCHLLKLHGKTEECRKAARKVIAPEDEPQSSNELMLQMAQIDPEGVFRRRMPFPRI